MDTKNEILANYARSLIESVNSVYNSVLTLGDSDELNAATIKTINILTESVRSQTVIFQQA